MTPETFKQLSKQVTDNQIKPLENRLNEAKKEIAKLESTLLRHQKFNKWCQYLTNGETVNGFFGCSPDYAMFVSKYSSEPPNNGGRQRKLIDADMVIIPDVLIPHELRVNIPTSKPNVVTNTSRKVNVPGIIKRIMKRSKNAKNILIGTFADVKREPCANCKMEAIIVSLDKFIDDDNGRNFFVSQLCKHCSTITDIAIFYEDSPRDHQYSITDGIYRHR